MSPHRTRSVTSPQILFFGTMGMNSANSAHLRQGCILQKNTRSMVKPVGVLAGYRVVDVLYYPSPRPNASVTGATWKSILVQTSTDRYTEIFHLQAFYTTASVEPSRILQSGDEPVLVTMDLDGGNGGHCWEGYWWFDSSGPISKRPSENVCQRHIRGMREFRSRPLT